MCQPETLEVLGSLWGPGEGVILTAKEEAAIMEWNQEGLRQMGLRWGSLYTSQNPRSYSSNDTLLADF